MTTEQQAHTMYDEIKQERIRQDAQWGGSEHDDQHHFSEWLSYIEKQIALARTDQATIRDRLVKIAALAVAAGEAYDRFIGAHCDD